MSAQRLEMLVQNASSRAGGRDSVACYGQEAKGEILA